MECTKKTHDFAQISKAIEFAHRMHTSGYKDNNEQYKPDTSFDDKRRSMERTNHGTPLFVCLPASRYLAALEETINGYQLAPTG